MEILRADLATCDTATGLVVAIDVLRAFTTAAYLFHAGVEEIILVASVREAFNLRRELPGCLIVGEVDGVRVRGFDLGNSPSEIETKVLTGKRAIQRTSAGTQGVVLASNAGAILAAALTNVSATVRYIRKLSPGSVTLIQTGLFPEEGWGDEDAACADAIENMLAGRAVDWTRTAGRVRSSRSGLHYDGARPDFPPRDLEMALQVDRFGFAMLVEKRGDLHLLHQVQA